MRRPILKRVSLWQQLKEVARAAFDEGRHHPAFLAAPYMRFVLGLEWDFERHRWVSRDRGGEIPGRRG